MHPVDTLRRPVRDLRISVTDRCNFRCTYCMPKSVFGHEYRFMDRKELLTFEELERVARTFASLGVEKIRLTGGEPLLRKEIESLVARLAEIDGLDLTLTTNASLLARKAEALRTAGLDRVNVSLDTVRSETFREITRRDRFADVVTGLEAARAAGLGPVKVNAVLLRGINDDQAPELLAWCLERGYELRFIEQMPLDAQHGWRRDEMVTAEDILASLEQHHVLLPAVEPRGSAPAELFLVDGGPATVGIIASVTRPFCGACDRVRLTADGQIRNCLFAREESDLRTAMRAGASDAELADRWLAAMATKKPGHGIDDPTFLQPDRPMSAIGG
jgi:cyclic pyranopterin phosphate synthase